MRFKWIAIIALIALVIFGGYKLARPVRSRCYGTPKYRAAFNATTTAIELYEMDTGTLPQSLDDLITPSKDPRFPYAYIRDTNSIEDGWGHQIRYTRQTNGYELRTSGPDHVFETADDIVKTGP